jgi:hypothetical protein
MCVLFFLIYVDLSSIFVKFELYKESFDKYLLAFWFSTDKNKKFYQA